MKNFWLNSRYYLEMISVPIFAWLVVHLSGHGLISLFGGEHGHEAGMSIVHEGGIDFTQLIEIWVGIVLLVSFVLIWHIPRMHKWIPCMHDNCCGEAKVPHVLVTVAFLLHLFPEAGVRQELFVDAMGGADIAWLGMLGFVAHFLIDIIVAATLSSYWPTKKGFWLSLVGMTLVWGLAWYTAEYISDVVPAVAEGAVFVLSGFLLAMFVHKPHRPVECKH